MCCIQSPFVFVCCQGWPFPTGQGLSPAHPHHQGAVDVGAPGQAVAEEEEEDFWHQPKLHMTQKCVHIDHTYVAAIIIQTML